MYFKCFTIIGRKCRKMNCSNEFNKIFVRCFVRCYLSYDHGGVLLSTKKDIEQLTPPLLNSKRQPHGKEPNW